jgi:hypothetical protein
VTIAGAVAEAADLADSAAEIASAVADLAEAASAAIGSAVEDSAAAVSVEAGAAERVRRVAARGTQSVAHLRAHVRAATRRA